MSAAAHSAFEPLTATPISGVSFETKKPGMRNR